MHKSVKCSLQREIVEMSLVKAQVRHGLKEQLLNNEKTCSVKAIKDQCSQ